MKRFFATMILFCAAAQAENLVVAPEYVPDAPSQHRSFWTVENKVGFGVLGSLIAADAITTQRGLSQGYHEANPLMRPLVTRGAGGEALGSALGFGAGLGVVYMLHQTHHYKAERIAMGLIVGTEGAVVGSNIATLR